MLTLMMTVAALGLGLWLAQAEPVSDESHCEVPGTGGVLMLQKKQHSQRISSESTLCAQPWTWSDGSMNWPNLKWNKYCNDCTALVLTEPYGGRCDNYCASFGHECVAAAEEVADNCQELWSGRCDQSITGTSDMLCTCQLPQKPAPTGNCQFTQKWPGVERSCSGCTALVDTWPYQGRCDTYCESFGHICTGAAEEVDETCTELSKYACQQTIPDTSDMLCTCELPRATETSTSEAPSSTTEPSASMEPSSSTVPGTSLETSTSSPGTTRPWPTLPPWDGESLLVPVSVDAPDTARFIPSSDAYLKPGFTSVQGPKQTNKFWANWVVTEKANFRGDNLPIFPNPYTLVWKSKNAGSSTNDAQLCLSHSEPNYYQSDALPADHYKYFHTPVTCEISLGAKEQTATSGHRVVTESLFGIHMEVYGTSGQQIKFPIFSGGAYLSGHYSGGFTPKLTSGVRALTKVELIRDGVWRFSTNAGKNFRVYLLDESGEFLPSAAYSFDDDGELSRSMHGWVRVAEELSPDDAEVLDTHARAILTDITLQVPSAGKVQYHFSKAGPANISILHYAYAHHLKLMRTEGREPVLAQLTPSKTPTKGKMQGVLGDVWDLRVNTSSAAGLGFLPSGDLSASRRTEVAAEVLSAMETFQGNGWFRWRLAMFRGDYYFSGKGFQKVAMVCLLLEELHPGHEKVKECIDMLEQGFRCLYEPSSAEDCNNAPEQAYYDQVWGGAVSSAGYADDGGCKGHNDFGNACYNDHHYHFGYFVTSAAILAKLRPSFVTNQKFIDYVDTLIRDTTNPSTADTYFPQFRAFDWFDLHSWSRGVAPNGDGKDQESTSEELNLLYGIHLWGDIMGNTPLKQLGETMLSLDVLTIREFFLMKSDNPHFDVGFTKNRVTGIFFQNKVDYTTWFGGEKYYIHGIQMLPLSPALQLSRQADFCQEEWDDVLRDTKPPKNGAKWTSVVVTGNLAIIDPDTAYNRLLQMHATDEMDDGLTKAWAMYWAAVQPR